MHGGEASLGAAPADRGGARPLVAHVLYRFDTGGLENGLVNLVNTLPADRFRHAIVALDRVEPSFAARVQRPDVEFIALHKPPGPTVAQFPRLWRLFRRLRPAIVHTRNLGALDCQLPAFAAGAGQAGLPIQCAHSSAPAPASLSQMSRTPRLLRPPHRRPCR